MYHLFEDGLIKLKKKQIISMREFINKRKNINFQNHRVYR